MRNQGITYLLAIMATVFILSCTCQNVDCAPDQAVVVFQFVFEGEDIIFGTNAVLKPSDITITNESGTHFSFLDSDNSLRVALNSEEEYEVKIPSFDPLVLSGITRQLDIEECCHVYQFFEFFQNDQLICSGDCTQIRIEL